MKNLRSAAVILSALLLLVMSCTTSSPSVPAPSSKPATPPALSEENVINNGARLFSEGRIGEAEKIWSTLADPVTRYLYLSFSHAYSNFDQSVAEAEAILESAGPEAAITATKGIGSPPQSPKFPVGVAADPRDTAARLARVGTAAAAVLANRATEMENAADADIVYASSGKDKDPTATVETALAGFAEASRLFRGAANWIPDADSRARRVDAKAVAAEETRRRFAKESLLSFPERMGEVFARTPTSPGRLNDKDLLAFNAETAAIISGALSDFEKIVDKYPEILDPATLDRLRNAARALSKRFARMESTMKVVQDRGRPLIPLIIGIFNPQPGDPQRSRPATFAGSLNSGSEWWWGIADIPSGVAQDLVITMNDARPVRVYAAGLRSGSRRPASDLINPLFKVGNSWPVLNAGARLENGVFHIEVGPSSSNRYSGEAVVYKSFMTRTR